MRISTEVWVGQNAMLGRDVVSLHREAIADLLQCSGSILFDLPDRGPVAVEFEILRQPTEEDWNYIPDDGRPMWWKNSSLSLSFELHEGGNREDADARERVANWTGKLIGDMLLVSNIARPGSLFLTSGEIYVDGKHAGEIDQADNVLTYAIRLAEELYWPSIRRLGFAQVWNWARSVPGFSEGVGMGRVGRALSAFSYLACRPEWVYSPADLMWGMIGLEALYAKGNEGLKSQLMEKSEVLLGRREAYKKRFSGMYDYRSRFVHGDLDLPFVYSRNSTSNFGSEAANCEYLATAMLLASLQELIIRGWRDINFDYKISAPGAA